jgi:aspartyl-tRNA(Asn)/glutamyl-tRNA(Gln) amidotransferase subunit B
LTLPLGDGATRQVTIQKLHLEEDAGKTVRQEGRRLIDFNRCGVPLVEMVTGPDLRSPEEAAAFLIQLRQLVRWLDISDADMERGQLRCDANVSLRPAGSAELQTKTEIKNINSIENVRNALEVEVERQRRVLEGQGVIEPWTLDWDEDSGTVRKMRTKETEADYRYFREPDLLPIRLPAERLEEILATFPELPQERRARFVDQYGLPRYDAEILTDERSLSDYFEAAVAAAKVEPKSISNWLMNDVLGIIRDQRVTAGELRLQPEHLAEIVSMVESGKITGSTGKSLLQKVEETGSDPRQIVEAEGLAQVSDEEALRALVVEILEENPEQVATYKGGKTTILGWFVGQLMGKTRGKANPQLARALFEEMLQE